MAERELIKISGTVEDIIFYNEDTGFIVLNVSVNDELQTVVGETTLVNEGEEICATGFYTSHPTYGSQFKAQIIEKTLPSTANAILKYLSSGAIKGIGPVYAKKLVATFGNKTMDIIENSPERLTEIEGITVKKAQKIFEEYRKIYGVRTLMIFLTGLGLLPATAIKVWKIYGNDAENIIRQNPYILCCNDFDIDFNTADEIADKMGMAHDNTNRIEAGIVYILRHNSNNGHTCLPYNKLVSLACEFLEVGQDVVEDTCVKLCDDRTIIKYNNEQTDYLYLVELYNAESYVAGRLSLMLQLQDNDSNIDVSKQIEDIEKYNNITYDNLQKKAITEAVNNNVFILTGGPGTGKTTTLNGILTVLENMGQKVALVAPTGRAAQRMSEVTGRTAKTIHRLLEVEPAKETLTFKHNEKNPLKHDVIIIDEMSMVDTVILSNLLCGIKISAKLIMVGDSDQLPSVSAGNILKDLIDSDVIPMVHLSTVFRQAAQSLIVTNAHKIVEGKLPDLSIKNNDFFFLRRSNAQELQQLVVDLCKTRLPNTYKYSPLWDIQVIVPTKKGPIGTFELNKCLQFALNPADKHKSEVSYFGRIYREGDKVMQIRNNYDIVCKNDSGEESMGVFNGDIGIVEKINPTEKYIHIRFDDRVADLSFDNLDQIELAYAITVHKSQGSEFEAVIMPLLTKHRLLHYRNLLYTAVTRAKKLLVMAGNTEVVAEMVANNRRTLRYTNLKEMLKECVNIE